MHHFGAKGEYPTFQQGYFGENAMTTETIKGLLIDPFLRTVTEVEVARDDYKALYPLLSTEKNKVDCFDVVRIENDFGEEESIFIDDNGLYVPAENQAYFLFDGVFLAGKGLIFGVDNEGGTVSTKITRSNISNKKRLSWPDHEASAVHAQHLLAASGQVYELDENFRPIIK
jgi:hypothetical protein